MKTEEAKNADNEHRIIEAYHRFIEGVLSFNEARVLRFGIPKKKQKMTNYFSGSAIKVRELRGQKI